MSPTKYLLAGAVASAFTALVGYLVYKWRARVDVQTKQDTTRIDLHAKEEDLALQAKRAALEAQAEPMRLMKDILDKREAELRELREQDRAERDQYIKTLTAMQAALEAIAKDLTAHREEERARAQGFYSRLDGVDKRLLVIETLQGQKPATLPLTPPAAA